MNDEIKALKERADKARILYNTKHITRDKAFEEVMPYITAFNKKSDEIAKKYGQKPKHIHFASYIR